jgi:Uma2 family endonuclease
MATAALPREGTTFRELTVADLADRLGSLPAWRVRTDVRPGAATEEDVERFRRDDTALCELIDGVLVEKAVSGFAAIIAGEIFGLLRDFVRPRRLGWLIPPDGFLRLTGRRLRAPDVSFIRRAQVPGGRFPKAPGYLALAPTLAVEVFSPGNTREEMDQKRAEYFASGSELVWVVYPETQTVEVAAEPGAVVTLARDATLSGEPVLPVRVGDIFDAVDLGKIEAPANG